MTPHRIATFAAPILWLMAGSAEGQTTRPGGAAGLEKVVATVGKLRITAGRVDRVMATKLSPPAVRASLARLPEVQRQAQLTVIRRNVLGGLIHKELQMAYARTIPCTDEELAAFKKELDENLKKRGTTLAALIAERNITAEALRVQAVLDRLRMQAVSNEKAAALLRAHPSYFDGTRVTAAHILISVSPYAPAKERAAARARLQKIADKIRAGDITFDAAARKHSTGPSKTQGGKLGTFPFFRMVEPFSRAAFALRPGQTSEVVRTQFGWHLIRVTGRIEGKGTPLPPIARQAGRPGRPAAGEMAVRILYGRLVDDILQKALRTIPVTVAK